MRKNATIIGTLILVAAIAIPVFAYERGWGTGRGMGVALEAGQAPYPCCENIANLTPEQSAKLKELREKHDNDVLPLRNELIAKRAELRSLWSQGNPDQSAIKAKQQEVNDLRTKLQDRMTEYRIEVGKILTPEQQAQLQSSRPAWGYSGNTKRPGTRGRGSMGTWNPASSFEPIPYSNRPGTQRYPSDTAGGKLRGRDLVQLGKIATFTGTLEQHGDEWGLTVGTTSYEIHLGPADYRTNQGFILNNGDLATVKGFVYGSDIAVTEIEVGGKFITLRDETGRPAWAGSKFSMAGRAQSYQPTRAW
jgi:Spy/CpxP family protein refolding chaperone